MTSLADGTIRVQVERPFYSPVAELLQASEANSTATRRHSTRIGLDRQTGNEQQVDSTNSYSSNPGGRDVN